MSGAWCKLDSTRLAQLAQLLATPPLAIHVLPIELAVVVSICGSSEISHTPQLQRPHLTGAEVIRMKHSAL